MSRMIHNADISYSSISNPAGVGGGNNFKQHRHSDNCCRTCFLNFPYATITSTFLVISGLIISFISIFHLLGIIDRLTQDLFYKHFQLSNEIKVVMFFILGFVAIVILINLIIGFATSFLKFDGKPSTNRRSSSSCFCSRNSTTNCLMRFVFSVNQLIFLIFFLLFLIFTLFTFILYIMKTLCNSEQLLSEAEKSFDNSMITNNNNNNQQEHSINLQPFSHYFPLQQNETNLLIFKDNRLKILCKDYISTLLLYTLISFLGIFLLFIGFYCYSINLTVNRIRIATYKKYTELLYLSNFGCGGGGTEMNAFSDTSFDVTGERF
ncbi:Neuronal membrane glycoprotein M6-b [Dermatophagoides pteronyssinus]|uniref:Neuronal membrane glycoprotein M6-b n=1 Tax=Dermatophagoides pteronyssinus TaxID=6956 RepID=A0ABQ8JIF9_DERPT|nr:Neuronal membrane glycoprotein M6-b [Dermatophagoides pteronyssinus]